MIVPGDDAERCADAVRPFLALYAGGMGARGANFHFEVFARMGYEDVATKVQELYLAGRKDEAAAAIPLAMVEDVALVGPPEKIRDELERLAGHVHHHVPRSAARRARCSSYAEAARRLTRYRA